MQPVNISTSDTLQYPLLVCLYKIVFNYQELRNIHDVLFASAIFLGPSFAFINFDCFCYFVENVSRTTRKWFFIQLYNYPTAGQLFSFIHKIDIFVWELPWSSFDLLWFRFSTFYTYRGKVLSTHYTRQKYQICWPTHICIYKMYIHGHIICSIHSKFGYPWIFLWVVTTFTFNTKQLWSMKTSNIQSKEPTTDIMIILNFKQVHCGFLSNTYWSTLKPHSHTFYEAIIC